MSIRSTSFCATGSLFVLLSFVGLAQAQGTNMSGFEAGVRLGYGLPLGKVSGNNNKLSEFFSGIVPLWLDVGYRINPNWYVGAYGQYGFGIVKDQSTNAPQGCPTGESCSAQSIRFGLMGQYHFLPAGPFDPWVGLGIGYEVLLFSQSVGAQEVSGSTSGFEFANLQIGGDYKVSSALGIGPFASFSFGQYSSASFTTNIVKVSYDLDDKQFHEWFMLGVRGTYGFF